MKTLKHILSAALLFGGTLAAQGNSAPDSTGLPGDHFSLEGALDLFSKAESIEAFEKSLNSEENGVNNLDLNQDGDVDYIQVTDHAEGDVHALVLHVAVNETEVQDVAVIEIEKNGAESAIAQILGDEELYGEMRIVEPAEVGQGQGGGGRGPSPEELRPVVLNVWLWPSVRFVYAPAYRPWVSPWGWRRYPGWYRPWRPHPWRWHFAHTAPYRARHRVVLTHRVVVAHRVYRPHRHTSVVVVNHYRGPRDRYRATHVHVVHPANGPKGGRKGAGPKGPKPGPRRR